MLAIGFIFLVLFLGDLLWGWKTQVRLRRLPRPWKGITIAGLLIFTFLQVAGLGFLFFGRQFDLPVEAYFPKPLIAAVYIWHCLILLPWTLIWFVGKVAAQLVRFGRILAGLRRRDAESGDPVDVSRREFVAAAVCAAPAIVSLGTTGIASLQWSEFRIRQLTVSVPKLPKALDGLTIAQVCDLHVGVFTRGKVLNEIVEATNQLHADLVFLPGDLINYSLEDLPVALDVAKRLEGKFGSFVCEGNHDLFEDAGTFREMTTAAGLKLLVNDSTILPIRGVPVQVLGLRWGSAHGDPRDPKNRRDQAIAGSMKELMAKRVPEAFRMLLAHHPHAFDYAEDIPLTFAGHTHGGQLMLTKEIGFGPAMFRYWSGLYQNAGRSLIVSNGVGNWFPLRVQAPAEIMHVTLREA